jgi:hypothetical protein
MNSNSFITDSKPEKNEKSNPPINNPNDKQLIPILDPSSSYVLKEENNLFYSKFGENSPSNELRDTIILKEGQNPSFKNIEIDSNIRALLAESPQSKDVIRNSFDFKPEQKVLLSKIQMAESVTEEVNMAPVDFPPPPNNINVIQNQIFTKKKKNKKVQKKKKPVYMKKKFKKVLSDVLKKKKKKKKEEITESERELDISALNKLKELQKQKNLKDSLEGFDFIGQNQVQELIIEPNANFENYIKENFRKVDKYMAKDFTKKPKKVKEVIPIVVQPKRTIKNMLLMGIEEEDNEDLPNNLENYPITNIPKEPNNAFDSNKVNEQYFNSDDSGRQPYIRDSDVPNQNILLSNNPYQSQNFHEPGLLNRLMSNHTNLDSRNNQNEVNNQNAKMKGIIQNDFEPKTFYNSEKINEEIDEIKEVENDFIGRFSQDKKASPPPTPASPLERKTKFTDLIAKKNHFMKKYNIKIGSRRTKKSKKETVKEKNQTQKDSKTYSNSLNQIPKSSKNNQFEEKKNLSNKIYSDGYLNQSKDTTNPPPIESNQSINTLMSIEQNMKESINKQFNNSGDYIQNENFKKRSFEINQNCIENPEFPNIKQASKIGSKSPNYQQTSGNINQHGYQNKWKMKNSINDIRQKYSKRKLN